MERGNHNAASANKEPPQSVAPSKALYTIVMLMGHLPPHGETSKDTARTNMY